MNSIERWGKVFLSTIVVGSMINMPSPTQIEASGGIEWSCINDSLPNDIQIEAIAINSADENTIYAAGQGGVYKTTDAGNNWTPINNGLPVIDISTKTARMELFTRLAIDPVNSNTLYVISLYGRIFKTIDSGNSWKEITNNLPVSQWEDRNIVISIPSISDTIYVKNSQGIYRSTDGGQTWSQINKNPLPERWYICDMVLDAQNRIYVGTYDGIFRSEDNGDKWNNLYNFTSSSSRINLAIAPSDPQIIYVFRSGDGIYKSTDGGSNWAKRNSLGLPNYMNNSSLILDPTNPEIVYLAGQFYDNERDIRALYKTIDEGDNWGIVTSLSTDARIKNMAIAKNTTHRYACGIGIYKSTDNDTTWSFINNGLPHYLSINGLAADPNNSGTIYLTTWRGVFKTTDYGKNWICSTSTAQYYNYYNYPPFQTIAIGSTATSTTVYIAGYKRFFKSSDGGNNWIPIMNGLPQYFNITKIIIDPNNPATIYAMSPWGKIYKSINGGDNWNEMDFGIDTYISELFIDPTNSNILYVIGHRWGEVANLYRSNNQGQNCSEIPISNDFSVTTLAFEKNATDTLYVGGFSSFYQPLSGGIIKVTNNGSSTSKISDKNVYQLIIHPQTPFIFYAISDKGIIKSIDKGKNWADVNEGLPEVIEIGAYIGTGTGPSTLIIDPVASKNLYLIYPPYGIYRGQDINTAPPAPIIRTPANNSKTSDNTPLIIGESQPGNIILIYEASNLIGSVTCSSNKQFIFTPDALTIGFHSLKFIATNPFGTSSPTNITIEVIKGVIPTIDSPASGATNQATVTITGIAEDGSTVVIYDGATPIGTTTPVNGIYSYTIILKDGLYKLYVKSTNSNEVISTSNLIELLIDTIAPPAPWILEPIRGIKTNNNKIPTKGKTISYGKVIIYDDGLPIGTVTADNVGNFEFIPQIPLSDGTHNITAKVVNAVNSISPASWEVRIFLDLKPVILHPRSGKTNSGTPTISGTAPPDTQVEVWVDDTNVGVADVTSSGTFNYQPTTPLSDRTHTIKVKNTSGTSNEVKLIIESQSPVNKVDVKVKQPWRETQQLDENDKVRGIRNRPMDVTIPIKGDPSTVTITIKSTGKVITLVDKGDGTFVGSFTPTSSTEVEITIIDEKGSSTTLSLMKIELIDPAGYVYNSMTDQKIPGAVVTCYWWDEDNKKWVIWDATTYGQTNPQITPFSLDFDYSFLVPKGKYYVYATATGYYPYQSPVLEVIYDPIHHDIYMEPIPVLTSIKVFPQSVVIGPGGTYSFTALGYDQYDRVIGAVECNWTTTIGQVNPSSGANTIFTAPNAIDSGIITAGTGSVKSGTASIMVRESTIIKLAPPNIYTRRYDTFTVDIVIENVVDLLGAKVVLSFDSSKIKAGTVSVSPFFSQNANVHLQPKVDNSQGVVEINGARLVTLGTIGVTGTGTLYSVSFTSIAVDSSGTVSITEVELRDTNLSIISAGGRYPSIIRNRLSGDFGRKNVTTPEEIPDNKIDFEDLVLFASYWNTQNPKGDIASTRTTGSAPNFTYEPDGRVDFEDLVYFAAMWNWYSNPKAKVLNDSVSSAIVRLKTVKMDEEEICLDIVVENSIDLLAGHFILRFDPDKLELATITSPAVSFLDKMDTGQVGINIASLMNKIPASGNIVRLTFHLKSAIRQLQSKSLNLQSAVTIVTVDLRDMQTHSIQTYIVSLPPFAQDLTKAYCYPNPYIPSKHSAGITFAELTENARIRIFDLAGELVYDSGMIPTTPYVLS